MSKTWSFSSHPVLPPSASLYHHVTGLGHELLHLCPVTAVPRGTPGAGTGRAGVCVPLCHETGPWTLRESAYVPQLSLSLSKCTT